MLVIKVSIKHTCRATYVTILIENFKNRKVPSFNNLYIQRQWK